MPHVKDGPCRDTRAVCVVGTFWTCPTCDNTKAKPTLWGLATPITVANMESLRNVHCGMRMNGGIVTEINFDTGVIYVTLP